MKRGRRVPGRAEPAALSTTVEKVKDLIAAYSKPDRFDLTRPLNQQRTSYHYAALHFLNSVINSGAHMMFLHALREYRHSPQERRALEAAVKLTGQSRLLPPRAKTLEEAVEKGREKYEEVVGTVAAGVAIVERVLREGDVCEKNQCAVAGCFRVVNTGGFDDKTMAVAEREVKAAADLVTRAGFGDVCYGDAYVTGKINKDNVLAFWMMADDRIYIRAKPKKGEEALGVETMVHELGHRLEKMLFGITKGHRYFHSDPIGKIYSDWIDRLKSSEVEGPDPEVGQTFKGSKRDIEYRVTSLDWDARRGRIARVEVVGDPKVRGTIPVDALKSLMGGKRDDPFPSPYSKTDKHEFFAELFRFYVVGKATPKQREAFEAIIRAGRG